MSPGRRCCWGRVSVFRRKGPCGAASASQPTPYRPGARGPARHRAPGSWSPSCHTAARGPRSGVASIRDRDALPHQQLANLGETEAVAEPALDRRALLDTPRPAIAARPPAGDAARGALAGRPHRSSSPSRGHRPSRRPPDSGGPVFGSSPSWAAMRFFGRPAPRKRKTSLTSIIVTSR